MSKLSPEALENPDYGKGVYRRRIVIDVEDASSIYAALEDEAHAFELSMSLEDLVIKKVEASWHRHPTTMCANANEALQELVGKSITQKPLGLSEQVVAMDNCTHFFDTAALVSRLACLYRTDKTQVSRYLYEIDINDAKQVEGKAAQHLQLRLNGELLEEWYLEDEIINRPASHAGQHILKGLISWAREHLDDEALMRAILIQKGYFVSVGRRYKMEKLAGIKCLDSFQPVDVCYAMRHGREKQARRTADRVSYSDAADKMLAFVPEKIKLIE